ncbi:cupin domain-containing protein [Marinomonas sp. THO17]|uniref:cupin domain-containing protein n=1 Tax=Marinomonas sp. THO17 TaxID=3149048 RepID=UPI00336BF653
MLNMDFSQAVLIDTDNVEWIGSPMTGVFRKPLAREEAERGHATSIVQYQPGSVFRPHPHPLGEEILVLEGTFSDETGDYHEGTYFRNPPGTSHAPHSHDGCLLLVKLHQFQLQDLNQISIDTSSIWQSKDAQILPLYQFDEERVYLVRMDQAHMFPDLSLSSSVEILLLSGEARYQGHSLTSGHWLRDPNFSLSSWQVMDKCFIWLKTGHF